ncbi:hypothetical protein PR002_g31962 [Phytophthora rubi]|uniref:DOT1 domain-containing protein n=1 Tax=Phytophthora rubi TaxID=129364 RepID=A0A6A3GCV8_9STRA|nr:hypothetical protein PR002_g31962 [Phytophthora rubi]
MEPLDERDVFLDVGAGIGNVLAQVALTTKVSRCIGVEVHVMAADVRDVLLSIQAPTSDATVIFASYFLFEETAKLVVARELGEMPKARYIASTSLFCPRHSLRCQQPFCARWKITQELKVACSWKSALTSLYIYMKI